MPFNLSHRIGAIPWMAAGGAGLPLLTRFPGAAAAYSLRNLNGDSSFNVVRVRRSSDNAEMDFTAAEVADGTLLSWVGANDGLVVTWYDQSVNSKHATQATPSSQPKIVNAGALVIENSKPAIDFDGVDDYLEVSGLTLTQPIVNFNVGKLTVAGSDGWFIGSSGGLGTYRQFSGGVDQMVVHSGTPLQSNNNFLNTKNNQFTSVANGALSKIRKNSIEDIAGNSGLGGTTNCNIGVDSALSRYYDGLMSEILVYEDVTVINPVESAQRLYYFGLSNSIDLWLIGGQSNADGRVLLSDPETPIEFDGGYIPGLPVYNNDYFEFYNFANYGQDGNGSGFPSIGSNANKWGFAHVALKNIKNSRGRTTVCQVSVSGSVLAPVTNATGSWSANYASIPAGTPKLLQELENRYLSLLAICASAGITVNVKGMIWHQGERDQALGTQAQYASEWSDFVAKVRSFTSSPNLPIFYGTISRASSRYDATIEAAQLNFAASDANAYCRDNSALTLMDSAHFDAASNITFGDWVSNTYLNL